jgi:hypothetical protein
VAANGKLGRATAWLDEVVVRAIHDGSSVAWKELEVGQDGLSFGKGGHLEEVIGEVTRPMDAMGLAPLGGMAPVFEGGEVRDQLGQEGLSQRVDIRHVDSTGNGEKDREQREVRVRVIKLEPRAARWLGSRGIRSRCARGGRAGRCRARNLIRLGAWEEGEQKFLASGRRRTDEADKPLVDTGAVGQTGLGQGHDVGVVEGVDNTSSEGFLGLRDQREGHLIDKASIRKREALIGVRVVEDGSTDSRRGVDSEELLESAV